MGSIDQLRKKMRVPPGWNNTLSLFAVQTTTFVLCYLNRKRCAAVKAGERRIHFIMEATVPLHPYFIQFHGSLQSTL